MSASQATSVGCSFSSSTGCASPRRCGVVAGLPVVEDLMVAAQALYPSQAMSFSVRLTRPAQLTDVMPSQARAGSPRQGRASLSQQSANLLRQRPFAGEPTWALVLAWEAPAARVCCDIHHPCCWPGRATPHCARWSATPAPDPRRSPATSPTPTRRAAARDPHRSLRRAPLPLSTQGDRTDPDLLAYHPHDFTQYSAAHVRYHISPAQPECG
jgi:hypothetical protein